MSDSSHVQETSNVELGMTNLEIVLAQVQRNKKYCFDI